VHACAEFRENGVLEMEDIVDVVEICNDVAIGRRVWK
jgi:hypothetical protein